MVRFTVHLGISGKLRPLCRETARIQEPPTYRGPQHVFTTGLPWDVLYQWNTETSTQSDDVILLGKWVREGPCGLSGSISYYPQEPLLLTRGCPE